ncbi:hypothetical protein FQN50_008231 [Emmonsiellopsis sp. PD_5]|nr:hypothetical protein FQN50_008231 [Emmonsiellopsis sp. PD_5]
MSGLASTLLEANIHLQGQKKRPPSPEKPDGHHLHDQSGRADEVGESASEDEAGGNASEYEFDESGENENDVDDEEILRIPPIQTLVGPYLMGGLTEMLAQYFNAEMLSLFSEETLPTAQEFIDQLPVLPVRHFGQKIVGIYTLLCTGTTKNNEKIYSVYVGVSGDVIDRVRQHKSHIKAGSTELPCYRRLSDPNVNWRIEPRLLVNFSGRTDISPAMYLLTETICMVLLGSLMTYSERSVSRPPGTSQALLRLSGKLGRSNEHQIIPLNSTLSILFSPGRLAWAMTKPKPPACERCHTQTGELVEFYRFNQWLCSSSTITPWLPPITTNPFPERLSPDGVSVQVTVTLLKGSTLALDTSKSARSADVCITTHDIERDGLGQMSTSAPMQLV